MTDTRKIVAASNLKYVLPTESFLIKEIVFCVVFDLSILYVKSCSVGGLPLAILLTILIATDCR